MISSSFFLKLLQLRYQRNKPLIVLLIDIGTTPIAGNCSRIRIKRGICIIENFGFDCLISVRTNIDLNRQPRGGCIF